MKIRLVCPVHHDVVLFENDTDSFQFISFNRTEYCEKCKKSYFENECLDDIIARVEIDDDTTKG